MEVTEVTITLRFNDHSQCVERLRYSGFPTSFMGIPLLYMQILNNKAENITPCRGFFEVNKIVVLIIEKQRSIAGRLTLHSYRAKNSRTRREMYK